MSAARLDDAIDRVVRTGNCSGCGGCALLDAGIRMELGAAGYRRPVRTEPSTLDAAAGRRALADFGRACPGVGLRAATPDGATRHPTLGPVVGAWRAWAADPEVRHRGSSGGTITALAAWLAEQGEDARILGARAAVDAPTRTESVVVTDRAGALAAAGSRYAPVATLAAAAGDETAIVGKPCEVSTARALGPERLGDPVLLSFFCAGTPSQPATDRLVEFLGMPASSTVAELWYRGRGWPGDFTAVATDGTTVSASYDESWGAHLGRAVQWRCKICPDGVGEHADIAAADVWRTDERGYPDFTEGDGTSALLARTRRGADLVARAAADGVLVLEPLDLAELAAVQPLQVTRRSTLIGRLVGTRLAGRPVPRFRGFGLLRLAWPRRREVVRTGRGTFRRVRSARGGAA